MEILYRYLRHYWKLAVAALVLAAINQVFSLLDPLIFRHIIDSYATRHREYSSGSSSAASACCWARRWASRSYPAWPRTSRITSST